MATGSYGAVTFSQANSASTVINIKKATAASHGTETGWNSSYGTGQATFTSMTFSSDYWDIDGQEGGGPGTPSSPTWDTGHGILVKSDANPLISMGEVRTGMRFHHMEITSNTYKSNPDQRIFEYDASNSLFEQLYIHDIYGTAFQWKYQSNNTTVQYCHFKNFWSTAANHEEVFADSGSNNVVVRWNLFENNAGTAAIAGINCNYYSDGYNDNWEIYGNIFYMSDTSYSCAGVVWDYNDSNACIGRNWKIYNNTVVKWYGYMFFALQSPGTGVFINNLVYQASGSTYTNYGMIQGLTRSYNYYSDTWFTGVPTNYTGETPFHYVGSDTKSVPTGNPLVNYAAYNFNLTAPLSYGGTNYPGTTLGSGYNNQDMYGNTRGADGVWDIGAIEFISGLDAAPSPPTNLRIAQ